MVTKAEIPLHMPMLHTRGKCKSKITFHTEHKPEDQPMSQACSPEHWDPMVEEAEKVKNYPT